MNTIWDRIYSSLMVVPRLHIFVCIYITWMFIHNNIAEHSLLHLHFDMFFIIFPLNPLLFIPTREFSYRTMPVHVLYDQIRVWCCRKSHEIQVAIIVVVQSMQKVKPLVIHCHCVLNVSKMFHILLYLIGYREWEAHV